MTVLVIGSTSEVGAEVARLLLTDGIAVRAMRRRPGAPVPAGAEPVDGDLHDPASLAAAFEDIERVFLISSPAREQVELETNAIEVAERTGVSHVVKISNLPIDGVDTGLHGNHRAIERRLAGSTVGSTVLQPSFFASVLARQVDGLRRGGLVLPTGDGAVAWIDPRDIAAVAAAVLADPAPAAGPLRLTGAEALTADALAARLATVLGRPVELVQPPLDRWAAALVDRGMDPWLVESTVHLYRAVARGALAGVSPDVERVLGRPPRPIDEWVRERLLPQLDA